MTPNPAPRSNQRRVDWDGFMVPPGHRRNKSRPQAQARGVCCAGPLGVRGLSSGRIPPTLASQGELSRRDKKTPWGLGQSRKNPCYAREFPHSPGRSKGAREPGSLLKVAQVAFSDRLRPQAQARGRTLVPAGISQGLALVSGGPGGQEGGIIVFVDAVPHPVHQQGRWVVGQLAAAHPGILHGHILADQGKRDGALG